MNQTGTKARVIHLPYPHAGQQAVLRGFKRFNYLVAGRRWYKSTTGEGKAIETALQGLRVMWCAPTFPQVRVAWDDIMKMAGEVVDPNQSRMQMKFPRGGLITFRSMEKPHNSRGFTADAVIIDEAASIPHFALTEVLRPMLITTHGWLLAIGTPLGFNWFHSEWAAAQADLSGESAAWQAPTLGYQIVNGELVRVPHPLENPNIPESEILSMWQSSPERIFRQEVLAEFVEGGGQVFRAVREISTIPVGRRPIAGHRYVFGIDWARSNDYTVISVFDATTREQVAIDRFSGIGWELQRGRVRSMFNTWKPNRIWAEENSIGGPNIEALKSEGMPVVAFTTTQASKDGIINSLSLAIERKEVKLLNDIVQIGELEAYAMRRLPGGSFQYSAPDGQHDDTVMALAIGFHGSRRSGTDIIF